ncbi:MAG TPA: hypothetical protein VFN91_19810 [Myxococcaceae bacterium]|nr:hypothetical protein [Myxococcaceae bacterium]
MHITNGCRGTRASGGRLILALSLSSLTAACGSGALDTSPDPSDSSDVTTSSLSTTRYTYQLFDPAGAVRTLAWAINDHGEIAGNSLDSDGVAHAFIRSASEEFTTFEIPGAAGITLRGINNAGVSVGFYSDGVNFHGFERTADGVITTIDFPGAVDSALLDINNGGDIAGQYDLGDQTVGGSFLLSNGHFTSLRDPPGALPFNVFASGINDRKEISGAFVGVDGNQHAFLLRGGKYTTFDDDGATVTGFSRLNDRGQIVGASDISGGFVLDEKTLSISALIACPGALETFPEGINNRGQVVGRCRQDGAQFHGFIATPVHGEK